MKSKHKAEAKRIIPSGFGSDVPITEGDKEPACKSSHPLLDIPGDPRLRITIHKGEDKHGSTEEQP